MKRIRLSENGKNAGKYFAWVDDEDYDQVAKFSWSVHEVAKGCVYAVSSCVNGERFYLHKFILGVLHVASGGHVFNKGNVVDFADGDGLNCRKRNMRICSRVQVCRNRRKGIRCSSKFKGVTKSGKVENTWESRIYIDKKNLYLGSFISEKKAAKAYDEAAKKYYGEFANLNFK